ncbi:TRAM domain-containing protein [Phytomonospora sp. NPDC050363]|uniref:class I SAM-dependent RNA methyltransferase n=1 Tax=Phytomonospora sp. NPDC050363 TaxID=3155642 RepID=UPI0033DE941D
MSNDRDLLTVEVGAVAHGGHCVARHDGRVIFVRHALPGETVRVKITERKTGYLRGDAVEILTPAPGRREAPCPYAHPGGCGGCDFQHADPKTQLDLKTAVLREQLVRLGGMSVEEVEQYEVEALPGGEAGWRTRMQYAVDSTGRAGLRGHRSHHVVPIDRCMVATPRIQEADVLETDWSGFGSVGVVDSAAPELSVHATRGRQEGHGRRAHAEQISGPALIGENVGERRFELMSEAFWQVHRHSARTFTQTVIELLDPQPAESAWDLYGGAGLFAVALAEAVGEHGDVTLVETDRRGNATGNLADLPQARAVYGDVAALVDELPQPDVIVLDPPRSGAGERVITGMVDAVPRAIAYVACDPAALGRDVKTFAKLGWGLRTLRSYDAFPMTHHFETIALFERV